VWVVVLGTVHGQGYFSPGDDGWGDIVTRNLDLVGVSPPLSFPAGSTRATSFGIGFLIYTMQIWKKPEHV